MHDDKKKSMEVTKNLKKSFSELYKIKKVMICGVVYMNKLIKKGEINSLDPDG